MTKEGKSVVQELDGDQRNKSKAELEAELPDRYDEGKSQQGAHKNDDPKDERSIANRLAAGSAASTKDAVTDKHKGEDDLRPTQIAESHGNKPSRGAKIDEQIELEEEAELRKKGKA